MADEKKAMASAATETAAVPLPGALDPYPRYMPDGSLDWRWFHEQREILESWWSAGLCVRCGKRPRKDGTAICRTRECESTPRPKWIGDRDECHFCGRKYGKSSVCSGGFGGPTTPVHVQYCPECGGRRPPSKEDAGGQGRLL